MAGWDKCPIAAADAQGLASAGRRPPMRVCRCSVVYRVLRWFVAEEMIRGSLARRFARINVSVSSQPRTHRRARGLVEMRAWLHRTAADRFLPLSQVVVILGQIKVCLSERAGGGA